MICKGCCLARYTDLEITEVIPDLNLCCISSTSDPPRTFSPDSRVSAEKEQRGWMPLQNSHRILGYYQSRPERQPSPRVTNKNKIAVF